jgi:hypothetical protein
MDPRIIMKAINRALGRTLKVARIGMKPHKFEAFHAFAMDEFGFKGLAREIYDLCGVKLNDDEWKTLDRTGPEPTHLGKKGGAP